MIAKIINYFKSRFNKPSNTVNICNCNCQAVPACKSEPSMEKDIANAEIVKDRIKTTKKQPKIVKTQVIVTKTPSTPRKKK